MKFIVGLLLALSATLSYSQNVRTFIPPQAFTYEEMIRKELERLWMDIPEMAYIPALIEHESCISLKHSRCFNPKSRLLTKREEGGGLGQLTRAYREDGSLRFDSLAEMRRKYYSELRELTWSNLYTRPDLQIRAIVLMSLENYNKLYDVNDPFQRLAMADSAYNGGLRDVIKMRRACSLRENCNANVWFGHVDRMVVKSTKPLYGNRSADDINKHHVKDVLYVRMPKYKENYFQ